jgi:hypothetical protein
LKGLFIDSLPALPLMRLRREGLFIYIGSRAARYRDGPGGAGQAVA